MGELLRVKDTINDIIPETDGIPLIRVTKLDVIGRQCWKIALNTTKGVNIVKSLEIFREFQHQL
jgi:hypothetical protein